MSRPETVEDRDDLARLLRAHMDREGDSPAGIVLLSRHEADAIEMILRRSADEHPDTAMAAVEIDLADRISVQTGF
jgi:hypothetical protein